MYSADFVILRRISVSRPLTSIVYFFSYYTILEISENWLNRFENGKTQLFSSGGVVK